MALIDTAPTSTDIENNLRMLIAEELAAQKSYREFRTQIYHREGFPAGTKEDLLRRIDEIIRDEEQHVGSLLFCLNLLNPETSKNMANGANGA